MKIVRANKGEPISLGWQGENNATQVCFVLKPFVSVFGPGVAQLAVQLPNAPAPYPAVLEQDGNVAKWTVGAEWLKTVGIGQCQLSWFVNDQIAKTEVYVIRIAQSIVAGPDAPEPCEGYLEQVQRAGAEALTAADESKVSAETSAKFAEDAEKIKDAAVTETTAIKEAAVKETADIKDQTQQLADAAELSAKNAKASEDAAAGYRTEMEELRQQVYGMTSDVEASKNAAGGYAGVSQEAARLAALSEVSAGKNAEEAEKFAKESEAHKDTALAALDALLLVDTATGNVAVAEHAAAMPLRNLTVNDGTEVQTVKAFGKNFFHRDYSDPVTNIGVTVEWDLEAQEFIFNGTTTSPGDIKIVDPLKIDWVPGEKYAVSVRHTGGTASLAAGTAVTTYAWGIFQNNATKFVRGATGNAGFVENYTFTATAFELDAGRTYIFYFQCWRPGTVFENYRVKVQIEQGASVTEWEPYREKVVALADTTTLPLTKGYNNIVTTPLADISVEYVQDTKLYFDARFAELEAAVVAMGGNV